MRQAVADDPLSAELMDAMLSARAALCREYCRLHDLVVKIVSRSQPWRRFLAIPRRWPGDGALVHEGDRRSVALSPLARCRGRLRADVAALAVGHLDRHSGPHLEGWRCRLWRARYEAGSGLMTRFKGKDKVKSWGREIAKCSCHRKAARRCFTHRRIDPRHRATATQAGAHVNNRKLLGAYR